MRVRAAPSGPQTDQPAGVTRPEHRVQKHDTPGALPGVSRPAGGQGSAARVGTAASPHHVDGGLEIKRRLWNSVCRRRAVEIHLRFVPRLLADQGPYRLPNRIVIREMNAAVEA